ncbi:MAG: hypothetical protein JSV26_03575 [bacterium]|nr:MAG: hypothetical protein JSV26_03575 [bacterium]
MGNADDRIKRLSVLLEAERAGVFAGRFLVEESSEDAERQLMEQILDGEKESCRLIGRSIVREAGATSGNVGEFYLKVMAVDDPADRLNLLIKGQEWVVRKLDEALSDWSEPQVLEDLGRIRRVHVENIEACRRFLAGKAK